MRQRAQIYWLAVCTAGVVLSMLAYANGLPAWASAVGGLGLPIFLLLRYLFGGKRRWLRSLWQRLRPFRSLILIYMAVLPIALYELTSTLRTGRGGLFISDPDEIEEREEILTRPTGSFPETLEQVYPDRPEGDFWLGYQLELKARQAPTLNEAQKILRRTRAHYERALAAGFRSDEGLCYRYALTLMRLEADPALIDAAINCWRRNFPDSDRRDLDEHRREIELALKGARR